MELILSPEKGGIRPPHLKLCDNCDHVHDIVDNISFQVDNISKTLFE